jgi:CRISPR-associated protein Cas2
MAGQTRALSEYSAMWLFAMFDLPVDTREARKEYTRFRKGLMAEGFSMLQFSVYARYCPSVEASEAHHKHIHAILPPDGEVRLIAITERQFGKMEVFHGKTRKPAEKPPDQLLLF